MREAARPGLCALPLRSGAESAPRAGWEEEGKLRGRDGELRESSGRAPGELREASSGGIGSRWILVWNETGLRDGRIGVRGRTGIQRCRIGIQRIPQLRGSSGRMFHRSGCRRSFPREPAPWWDGPWPHPPAGPEDTWDEPPWDGPPQDGPTWDAPAWDEPPRDGPPRDGPAWDEPPRDGPPRDGPAWDGSPRHGPPQDGPPKHGPVQDAPARDGPPRDGPPRHGPPRHEPPRHGPPRDGPPQDGPAWDGPPRHEPPRDGPPRHGPAWHEPAWDEPPRHGPARDGPPRDEPAWDGPPRHEPPRDGPPRHGPPQDGPPRHGPPRDGPPRHGPAWDGPPRHGPPRHGPPRHGPPRDGPPRHGPPRDEAAWNGPAWEQQPSRRQCRRHPPSPRAPRAFRGPGDISWKEEERDRRWAPPECPLPPPWDDRAAMPGAEGDFGECWYQDPPPDPWPEYPEEEQPQPWPPSGPAGNPGNFHQHRPPWSHHPAGTRRSHPRQLLLVPRARCPRPSRGHKPRSKPSCPAPSRRSQPGARKEPQPPEPPQAPAPPPGAAERREQPQVRGFTCPLPSHSRAALTPSPARCPGSLQDVPVGTGNVLEPPSPARSPLESPAADAGAAELQVKLEAGQSPVGSQDQDPCAPGTDPAPPEETSRNPEIQEHLEVEPCSVPKAGSGHGSHPQSPAAPPDPAKREILEISSCSGEAGAELSPHSWEQPPCGAGEAEAEAAQAGPLQSLQPPENPQLPPGSAAEPKAQPSQASPGACTTPVTSPQPQHPPGAGDTNLAVCGQQQLCSEPPTPSPADLDSRLAAVLRRKAKIELSYQQFSLSIAVVATMLLHKEPSMEAALGVALRANLRQGCLHHLQQLEEFIDSLDSMGSPSL
uniref:basic proline-rich protein-like isoform X1 n=1 Tax=Agelaius phoeniceus TaxID=39638 RepID=UPI0023EB1561|nr:basic proline-rich protein-like isoform X1 [Agelaius phoeniceus]